MLLKRFSVKGFRNFHEEITIDFSKVAGYTYSEHCLANLENGRFLKRAQIVGPSNNGKTNLCYALYDIKHIEKNGPRYIDDLYNNEHSAEFSYVFALDDKEIEYSYSRMSNGFLTGEKFSVNGKTVNIWPSSNWKAETNKDKETAEDDLNGWYYLQKLIWFVKNMDSWEVTDGLSLKESAFLVKELAYPDTQKRLKDFIYDIMSENIDFSVFISKEYNILENGIEIMRVTPWHKLASTSLIMLLKYYCYLYGFSDRVASGIPSFLIIDDFNKGLDFDTSVRLATILNNNERLSFTQIVQTTSSYDLVSNEWYRPDAILSLEKGKLGSLHDLTERELRFAHNLRKMYIAGEFSASPNDA